MLDLLLFLTLLSSLGCFLFITRFHHNRLFINIIGFLLLFCIDIILPNYIWPHRNLSNCTAVHITTSIYIFIITYKLFEIFSDPNQFFKRHNITKIWQVFICLITPSQIDFISIDDQFKYKTRWNAVPILIDTLIIIPIISFLCINIILYFKLFESSYSLFWQYFFCIFLGLSFLAMQLLNFLSCIVALIFGNHIDIKYSYKWPLFQSYSPRSMWKNWSVVVGESLKYLIYIPLGKRKNILKSVMCLFGFNCMMHFYYTWLVHGQFAIIVNIKVFTIFGVAVAAQILCEHLLPKHIQKSIFWKIFWFIILYISVITAVIAGYPLFFVPIWNELFDIYGIF